jgi:cytoskeletal protein CcmA (bactofilin family)
MAYTVINTTDTLEQMRVKLNNLTTNDFGDPSVLAGAGISSTSITGAVVELAGVVFSTAGFRVEDSTSTFQQIGAGETLKVLGTSNQINAVVSATDTLTLSLTSNVTVPNNLTASGTLHTLGTIEISGNNIRSTDSTTVRINDSLSVNGAVSATSVSSTGAVSGTTITGTGAVSGTTITGSSTIQGTDLILTGSAGIQFEGSTADNFETTLVVVDPTADRTITIPNVTGTVVTTGDTGTVTSTMIADGTIVNGDIADTTIRGAKLNVSTDSVTFGNVTATNFTGTASVATAVTLNANNSNNETVYLVFSDTATGNQSLETDTGLSYNPSTNILSTTSTQAQYADLAEIYVTDKLYEVGTVVMVGGEKEVTECFVGKRALGVISDRPAFLMNSQAKGQPVALKGRVKVKVVGAVKKGDELVAGNGGFATTISEEFTKVFAIALEDNEKGIIEAIIL